MTKEEIKAAIEYGKNVIKLYKELQREVPSWCYERQVELYEMLLEK